MDAGGVTYAVATTMSFAGIVAVQAGNVFACRTERASVFTVGFFSNRFILMSILAEICIALILIYTPALSRVFGFSPPGLAEWALMLSFAPVILAAEELRKLLMRQKRPPAVPAATKSA